MDRYHAKQYLEVMEKDFREYVAHQYPFHLSLWTQEALFSDREADLNEIVWTIFSQYDGTITADEPNKVQVQFFRGLGERYEIDFEWQSKSILSCRVSFAVEEYKAAFSLTVNCDSEENASAFTVVQEMQYLLKQFELRVAEPLRMYQNGAEETYSFISPGGFVTMEPLEELQEKAALFEQKIPRESDGLDFFPSFLQENNHKQEIFQLPHKELTSAHPMNDLFTAIRSTWGNKVTIEKNGRCDVTVQLSGKMKPYSFNFYFPHDEMITTCFYTYTMAGEEYPAQFEYCCQIDSHTDLKKLMENADFLLRQFQEQVAIPFESRYKSSDSQ